MQTWESAFRLQSQWLQRSVSLVRLCSGSVILRAIMQQILDDLVDLTKAEEGSIFLVDEELRVIEAILARGVVTRDRKQLLVGEVLDRGFGGWVLANRTFGVVDNTERDDRWVHLPDEPYQVKSALGAPLLYSDTALGVLTLMHSQPYHFTSQDIELVKLLHDQMALLIENARLHAQYQLG